MHNYGLACSQHLPQRHCACIDKNASFIIFNKLSNSFYYIINIIVSALKFTITSTVGLQLSEPQVFDYLASYRLAFNQTVLIIVCILLEYYY